MGECIQSNFILNIIDRNRNIMGSGQKTNTTGNNVADRRQCTQGRKTSQDLHRDLMGVNRNIYGTIVEGNGMGGATGTAAALTAGKQNCTGRGVQDCQR